MARDKKTVSRSFGYLRCDDFARYLEEMAAQGWHLESWGTGLHFRKGEPEQAVYAVEVFTDASEYDTRPEPNTKEFAEYCEAAGWHMVDAKQKIVIFKRIRPDAIPIMTDSERLEAVAKEEQKKVYRNLAVSGTWVLLRWLDFFGSGFANAIFSTSLLMIRLGWIALFAAAVVSFVHLLVWKNRSRKRIDEGLGLYLGRGGNLTGFRNRGYTGVLVVVEVLWLGCLATEGETGTVLIALGVFAGLWLLGYLIAKKRPDAVTNEIISVVVSSVLVVMMFAILLGTMFADQENQTDLDQVPLFYEDIGGEAGELGRVLVDKTSSPFGSALHCALDYEDEYFYYYVYQSDHSWVLDRLWADINEGKGYASSEDYSGLWASEAALRAVSGTWAVRYPGAILIFDWNDEEMLTPEQTAIIRSALCD